MAPIEIREPSAVEDNPEAGEDKTEQKTRSPWKRAASVAAVAILAPALALPIAVTAFLSLPALVLALLFIVLPGTHAG